MQRLMALQRGSIRLADTDLILEVEEDHTHYGDEIKFGGGKVIRDGMGQSQQSRDNGVVDTVITNALFWIGGGLLKLILALRWENLRDWKSRKP